jgi:hypothetical protein
MLQSVVSVVARSRTKTAEGPRVSPPGLSAPIFQHGSHASSISPLHTSARWAAAPGSPERSTSGQPRLAVLKAAHCQTHLHRNRCGQDAAAERLRFHLQLALLRLHPHKRHADNAHRRPDCQPAAGGTGACCLPPESASTVDASKQALLPCLNHHHHYQHRHDPLQIARIFRSHKPAPAPIAAPCFKRNLFNRDFPS